MKVNLINFSKIGLIVSIFLFFSLFFNQNFENFTNKQVIGTFPALAADEEEDCGPVTVSLVLRNEEGEFIPNIDYSIYSQVYDADNNLKPGSRKASGKTNTNTGIGLSEFDLEDDEEGGNFLIKVWDENANIGAMYFYDALQAVSCGASIEKELELSAINIVFRDSQGDLKTDIDFKIYSQKYDTDGDALKDQVVGSFDMDSSGEMIIYLADDTRAIDDDFSGKYVLEAKGIQGGTFLKYNIRVDDTETTNVNYKFSDIAFTVKDAEGVLFPSDSLVKIYEQEQDLDGDEVFGNLIKKITTNDKGVAVFEYPAGVYAASIVGGDGQLYKYYDLTMRDQRREEITLQTTETYIPGGDLCSEDSFVDIITRSANGDIIPDLKVALYEQLVDANGVFISGDKKVSGETADTGIAHLSFKPDPRATYILNVYDKADDAGEFWFFDNFQFSCGEDKEISKTLSSIKVIIRDVNANVMPGQYFSIYAQKYDIDGNPTTEKNTLVKKLETGVAGYASVYVASDHPYDDFKKGIYAFYVKIDREEFIEYNINVDKSKETVFNFNLADINPSNNGDSDGGDSDYNPPARAGSILQRLQGYILLQVEEHGEAWYVDNASQKRFYMKDGPVAYEMLRRFGLGISNQDLEKIPIGLDSRLIESDSDGDGLPDKMEEALGSDVYNSDSDGDGFSDGDEVKAGYSPISTNKSKIYIDKTLTGKLLGKILLQVESRGEAWYLNPQDGKRYYMKDGNSAYEMMRFLSLGITNQDLNQIPSGTL